MLEGTPPAVPVVAEQSDTWLVRGVAGSPNTSPTIELRNLSTGESYHMSRAEARVLTQLLTRVEVRMQRRGA